MQVRVLPGSFDREMADIGLTCFSLHSSHFKNTISVSVCLTNNCKQIMFHDVMAASYESTTPAIAQLVEHLTVDAADIRWSLVRFRVAGFLQESRWQETKQRE